ncbi:hypothetical protein FRC15_011478 [Serendipita sp. 397]|nr:hypothetical protein FRC15_011478 [Serendipita sp. 397]
MDDPSIQYSSVKVESDVAVDSLNASNTGPLYAQWQGSAVSQSTPGTTTNVSTNRDYLYAGPTGYSNPINGNFYGNRSHSPIHETSMSGTTSSQMTHANGYAFAASGTSSALVSAAPSPSPFAHATISRPPSVVHSPAHVQSSGSAIATPQETFASRGRSTSYSGPYFAPAPTMDFSTYPSPSYPSQPHAQQQQQAPMSYFTSHQTSSVPVDSSDLTKNFSLSSGATGYYNTDIVSALEQPAETDRYSYGAFGTTSTTLTPISGSNQEVTPTMSTPASLPPANSVQSLPPPIAPLSSSIATGGTPTIPRSMSMGSIPGSTSSPYASSAFNMPYGHSLSARGLGLSSYNLSFTSNGRTGSSGTMTPENGYPRSHAALMASNFSGRGRLTGPSLTIPSSSQYLADHDYMLGSAGVSPTTNGPPGAPFNTPTTMGGNNNVLSSLAQLRGTGSGPGTASNGGSLPLTPITSTESGEMFDYHAHLAANLSLMSGIGSAHSAHSDGTVSEEYGDSYGTNGTMMDGDDSRMSLMGSNGSQSLQHSGVGTPRSSSPHRTMSSMLGGGSSPMGGVTRTEKKRRSTTMAAGPSAMAAVVGGASRSRSGTLANGSVVVAPGVGIGGLGPLTTITGGMSTPTSSMASPASMSVSPVQLEAHPHSHGNPALGHHSLGLAHGHNPTPYPSLNMSVGLSDLARSSAGVPSPLSTMMTPTTVLAPNGAILSGNGQAPSNSPLAMKELSPTMKPLIEEYLLRYLNYLCMNPNAKDRMGHQIHQMYTARRIQRYEQLYGWRPLKFRIEAFVNGFVDLLTARGMSQDITMKIPHYLNNSKLFSRFNESGNRMKSQGQTIWRVRARCKTDIPGVDAPAVAAAATAAGNPGQPQSQVTGQATHTLSSGSNHSPSSFTSSRHDDIKGLMMCPDPLLWEFLPYERCIVGQPPLAIVGTAWQWNMKVHDHWTPRKKINWNIVPSSMNGSSVANGSPIDPNSPSSSACSPTSSDSSLPKWLSLQGSKLKGTPTHPGVYPITIEATFQEDHDPEPVIVRGSFTINVSKAIGGWKNKVPASHDGIMDSPEDAMDDGLDGDDDSIGNGHSLGGLGNSGIGGGNVGSMHTSSHPFMFRRPDEYVYGVNVVNPRMPLMQPQYTNTNGGLSYPYVH